MADQLYLSVWFPNFRLIGLPAALAGVLHQFARVAADGHRESPLERVAAATVYPIDWTESPLFQRIYVNDGRSQASEDSTIDAAVAEATEQMHDDCAYEFEMRWLLWQRIAPTAGSDSADEAAAPAASVEVSDEPISAAETSGEAQSPIGWKLEPVRVRIVGFGPEFDAATWDQNGHVRIDFGPDTAWVQDDLTPDPEATPRLKANVEKLLAFTLSVEKHCGISSRLLWTESGEPLAEKLIARLQRLN
jgi:hypothetical protein